MKLKLSNASFLINQSKRHGSVCDDLKQFNWILLEIQNVTISQVVEFVGNKTQKPHETELNHINKVKIIQSQGDSGLK